MRVTPAEAAQHFYRAARALEKHIETAEEETLQEAYETAIRLSQGRYSLQKLARMGHPYARAHPRPPQDEAIINAQSRRFLMSWGKSRTVWNGDGTLSMLVNDAPHAKYLYGTSLMIPRPIVDRIAESVLVSRRRRLAEAVRKALYPRY